MKKWIEILVIVVVAVLAALPVWGFQPAGIGVSGRFSGIVPTNGDFTSAGELNDAFDAGITFGGQVSYTPVNYVTIVGGFDYGFMEVKDEQKAASGNEPNVQLPQIFLKGQFNFSSLIKNLNNRVNPYVSVGAGLYPWKITSDGVNGDAQAFSNGEEFKKTSFGLLGSVGTEIFVIDRLSVFAEGTYHFVFAEDVDKFAGSSSGGVGTFSGFDDQGFATFGGGVTYYFPL
ncbi:MAG: hypothetical protein L0Z48_04650 [candidate division Zixibacteria bacterium]|nr:hypothetical protein [candidate division Zixibacteria bacterium]MCI0595815.1 hypothetical protein [candidate division Zixibacteria bacterium]